MGKILVIDDEPQTRALLSTDEIAGGHEWIFIESSAHSIEMVHLHMPNLIVMDVLLSRIEGKSLFLELRSAPRTSLIPLIIMTGPASECGKLEALKLGAEDYLTKPFSPEELALRVAAILRRAEAARQRVGPFLLDRVTSTVHYGEFRVKLTATEFRLFAALIAKPGIPQTRQNLLREVWGHTDDFHSRTLDTHIKRLRRRLGEAGSLIHSIKGVGYQLELNPSKPVAARAATPPVCL